MERNLQNAEKMVLDAASKTTVTSQRAEALIFRRGQSRRIFNRQFSLLVAAFQVECFHEGSKAVPVEHETDVDEIHAVAWVA